MINRRTFFEEVRASLFRGNLSQSQVDGMNRLLDAWETDYAVNDNRWLAYCLATAFHETAHTMQPVAEYGKGRGKPYGKKGHFNQAQYGRGYVQLTWDRNYERADHELGLAGLLMQNFDLALQPDIAAQILFLGMIQGWFTGKKLSDYIKPDREADYRNARRIVNGMDRAALIAGYAEAFEEALVAAEVDGPAPIPDLEAPLPAPRPNVDDLTTGKSLPKSTTFWTTIGTSVTGALSAIAGLDRWVAIIVVLVIVAGAAYVIMERRKKAREKGV